MSTVEWINRPKTDAKGNRKHLLRWEICAHEWFTMCVEMLKTLLLTRWCVDVCAVTIMVWRSNDHAVTIKQKSKCISPWNHWKTVVVKRKSFHYVFGDVNRYILTWRRLNRCTAAQENYSSQPHQHSEIVDVNTSWICTSYCVPFNIWSEITRNKTQRSQITIGFQSPDESRSAQRTDWYTFKMQQVEFPVITQCWSDIANARIK